MKLTQQSEDGVSITVSVITVVFNGVGVIEGTLKSVLGQNYPNIEYIVIDGASSDGTTEVIGQYESRLAQFISEPDDGVYDAMNKGISAATGEFILFMNCGDVFAGEDAVTSAMQHAQFGHDQLLFGRWRRSDNSVTSLECQPNISKGLFNHQAVIYSRNIHTWHGEYLSVKGLTTADYLFFSTIFDSPAVKCKIIDTVIAVIDTNGISAGVQTLGQKYAIDYLCSKTSKTRLVMVLLFHPIYRCAKKILEWLR